MRKNVILIILIVLGCISVHAQRATLRIDSQKKHQHITGFGAFVCSSQFQYGYMSNADIEKVWMTGAGKIGCNIMRLFIPIGRNYWSQSLATAKKAKEMGLIVFASPWGQPAEWKTNGTSNAMNSDGTLGSLKKENWGDYAKYLDDYVKYMRDNGVELDAISIQNEPDWHAEYAGCMWTASEISSFVKTYGQQISCKVMAPETLGDKYEYSNALNNTETLKGFDIYGTHQYGGVQSAHDNLVAKGKEIWMTEYLINWDEEEKTVRDFDFNKDFFNFFHAINVCMLGDFNAWIHYTAKRYYGLIGDGEKNAGASGTITKRGRIMSHFARFVTGYTRIDMSGGVPGLEGSVYLSSSGDTVVAVLANTNDEACELTFDLPFYTKSGQHYYTGEASNENMRTNHPKFSAETCRPTALLPKKTVNTVLYVRSSDRQQSNMKGSASYYDRVRIDDLKTTNANFGTAYKLSGAKKTFDKDNPLISSRNSLTAGYIKLDGSYDRLVMHVNKVTTTNLYTAGATTLVYVNGNGTVSRHDYGRVDLSAIDNFDVVFDLTKKTLTDGIKGLLQLTCDNASSHLTINFGEVYLTNGGALYAGTLSGDYVADDSYVLDFTADTNCTSIDMTGVNSQPATLPWLESCNRVVYVGSDSQLSGDNVVKGTVCSKLTINEAWGPFRPATSFTATAATYTCTVNGQHIVQLPFAATVPDGVIVYLLTLSPLTVNPEPLTTASAGQPLLLVANGEVTFSGSGEVTYSDCPLTDAVLPLNDPVGILSPITHRLPSATRYNLMGQKVNGNHRGIVIVGGKKHINR